MVLGFWDIVGLIAGAVGTLFSAIWWLGRRTVVRFETELKDIRYEVIQLDKRQAVSESHINNIKEAIERVEKTIQKSEENLKRFIKDLLEAHHDR